MRGFGDTEPLPIDATRGVRDWADDTHALVRALGVERPLHLVGWSTGGAAVANYAVDRPVASLTFVDPVSPYGYGAVKADGSPCWPDYAGSGGGTGAPEFIQRLAAGDRSSESPFSPRNVMNSSYWSPSHREPPEREEILLDEVRSRSLATTGTRATPPGPRTGRGWRPAPAASSNALSPKYCNWADVVDLDPKPPVLWTHGSQDIVVADGSPWEMGTLGKLGMVPGWPGEDVFPPQPMVSQIRAVLERYRDGGGRVRMETFEGSGHGPVFDAADRWKHVFFEFLGSVE